MIKEYIKQLEQLEGRWDGHEETMHIILKILIDIRDHPELLDKYIDEVRWG